MRRDRARQRAVLSVGSIVAVLLALTGSASADAATNGSAGGGRCLADAACVPQTVVLDGRTLRLTRDRARAGDPGLRQEVRTLTARADTLVDQGPWSVMDKPQTPPGGDRHDYLSQAPYWWPSEPSTADNPQGCPYVQRDGVRNPDVDTITDHAERGRMFDAVYTLTLAWYYTGNPAYARRAELDLRTWFTDPATRMNPNLQHTQIIPCKTDGRGIGIIDFSQQFTDILDATALLDTGAPGWTDSDHREMHSWYDQYLQWLLTSGNAADEAAATNNHGSFFDMQEAALALATGRTGLARDIVEAAESKRLDSQLAADGSQPQEISRTRSWHYSTFNLVALTRLADIGRKVGVDLWHYTTPAGATLSRTVDYLLPAATGAADWSAPELSFHAYAATDVVHAAADAGDRAARTAVPELEAPPGGDLWRLRPAAEQLDSIES
ncbi:alginate lyase family protein [Streptomyces sp. NPDC059373]